MTKQQAKFPVGEVSSYPLQDNTNPYLYNTIAPAAVPTTLSATTYRGNFILCDYSCFLYTDDKTITQNMQTTDANHQNDTPTNYPTLTLLKINKCIKRRTRLVTCNSTVTVC